MLTRQRVGATPKATTAKRGVEQHGAPRPQNDAGAPKHLGIHLFGELGVVRALPRPIVDGLHRSDPDHLLARAVRIDDGSAHLQAERTCDGALAAGDHTAHGDDRRVQQGRAPRCHREHEAAARRRGGTRSMQGVGRRVFGHE